MLSCSLSLSLPRVPPLFVFKHMAGVGFKEHVKNIAIFIIFLGIDNSNFLD